MYVLAVISLIWIAYRLAKDDGKWWLVIILGIVFLCGLIMMIISD